MRTTLLLSLCLVQFLVGQQSMANWQDEFWVGFAPGADVITLRVYSSGCTKKDDFELTVGSDSVVSVKRIRNDTCRAKPRLVDFEYSFSELTSTQSKQPGADAQSLRKSDQSLFFRSPGVRD